MCIKNSSANWRRSLFLLHSVVTTLMFHLALYGLFHFNHTFTEMEKRHSRLLPLIYALESSFKCFSFSAVLVSNHTIVTQFCKDHNIGLVLVGPEALLAAGKLIKSLNKPKWTEKYI